MSMTNLATNPSFETASGTVEVRRNRLTNPSFEVDTTGWGSLQTVARDATSGWSGGASLKVTHTADGNRSAYATAPAVAGKVYTLSGYLRHNAGVNRELRIDYAFEDSTGARLGVYTAGVGSFVAGGSGFTRVSVVTGSAPTGTAVVRIYTVCLSMLSTETFWMDAALVEEAPVLGSYFDGTTAAAGDFTYAWTGAVNASASIERGADITSVTGTNCVDLQSSEWGVSGKSLRIRPTTTSIQSSTVVTLTPALAGGKTYTAIATRRLSAPLTGTLTNSYAGKMAVTQAGGATLGSPQMSNTAGEQTVVWTFATDAAATAWTFRLGHGGSVGSGDVWWDNLAIVEGTYTGPYFDGDTPTVANARYAWTGTPHASTSTYTFRGVTVEGIADAPCPRAGVTVEGLSPGDHQITVWRTADGERNPVRGMRTVTVVDSFYQEDYEVPLGRLVHYELEILSGPDAGLQGLRTDARVESASGWIQDPLNPASAVPVHGEKTVNGETYFRSQSFASIAYRANVTQHQVMGDPRPVSISGPRMAASGIPLAMSTRAEAENVRLRDLVQEAVHLVIRPLPEWGDYIPSTATYAAATVEEQPVDVAWGGSLTRWETTGDIVRPSAARVLIALWRYQDVAEIFATYDQKQAAAGSGTYLEDQKDPANTI